MVKRRRRTAWLMFAAVAIGGALLVWAGLYLVNRRVEREVRVQIDRLIAGSELEGRLSYDSVDTRVALGILSLRGLEYRPAGSGDGDQKVSGPFLRAETVSIDLPTREAPRLISSPGNVSFTEAKVTLEGFEMKDPAAGDRFTARNVVVKARGEVGPRLLSVRFGNLARHLFSLRLQLSGGDFEPGNRSRARFVCALGFDPLEETGRVVIDELTAHASLARSSREVTVEKTAVNADVLQAEAEGKIELDGEMRPESGRMRLTVREIDPQLRTAARDLLAACGAGLPDQGGFTLRIAAQDGGEPDCRVEEQ